MSQARECFQYRKQIEELVLDIQSNLLRVTNTQNDNQSYTEVQKQVNIVNLTEKTIEKYLLNIKKCDLVKIKAEKNKAV